MLLIRHIGSYCYFLLIVNEQFIFSCKNILHRRWKGLCAAFTNMWIKWSMFKSHMRCFIKSFVKKNENSYCLCLPWSFNVLNLYSWSYYFTYTNFLFLAWVFFQIFMALLMHSMTRRVVAIEIWINSTLYFKWKLIILCEAFSFTFRIFHRSETCTLLFELRKLRKKIKAVCVQR